MISPSRERLKQISREAYRRYEAMPNTNTDPNLKFMVWDWEANDNICYCHDKDKCELIANTMNIHELRSQS